MRDRIMRGWPFTPEEREAILVYCAEDTKLCSPVYRECCRR